MELTDLHEVQIERLNLIVDPPVPQYEIRNPHWDNSNRDCVRCEFNYADGRKLGAVVHADHVDGVPQNLDWIRIMQEFTPEEIEKNTQAMTTLAEERKQQQLDAHKRAQEIAAQEQLTDLKLEALQDIELIKESKNQDLKKRLRKAKSLIEVFAYSTLLIQDALSQ
jgi:uncharacterized protein YqgV (UPF0045/DUF77 family)